MHIQIINPNTSVATTKLMVEIAKGALPPDVTVTGITARTGVPLIVNPTALAHAADVVLDLQDDLTGDAVIVAAFGDPGADRLRDRLAVPVIGIGEAAIRAAAENKRRFSIATTTPLLVRDIQSRVESLGVATQLAGIHVTSADPSILTADAASLEAALAELVERCVEIDRAEAVIIGGGPLSNAARALSGRSRVPIIEPLPEAARWVMKRLND